MGDTVQYKNQLTNQGIISWIETLIEEFIVVLFEKSEPEYRDMSMLIAILPLLVKEDTRCDVKKNKFRDIMDWLIRLKWKSVDWHLGRKKKQMELKKFEFECRDITEPESLLVFVIDLDSTAWSKNNDFYSNVRTEKETFKLRPWTMKSVVLEEHQFENQHLSIKKNFGLSKIQCSNRMDSFLTEYSSEGGDFTIANLVEKIKPVVMEKRDFWSRDLATLKTYQPVNIRFSTQRTGATTQGVKSTKIVKLEIKTLTLKSIFVSRNIREVGNQ